MDNEAKYLAGILLEELLEWASEKSLIPVNQTGFDKSVGTTTNILTMGMLIDKAETTKILIHLCFIDDKAAFDYINQNILWSKLKRWGIPRPLLDLLINLHKETWIQIKLGDGSLLSTQITTNKGLKQGCVLAPTLFNLFLGDLIPMLNSCNSHAPKFVFSTRTM